MSERPALDSVLAAIDEALANSPDSYRPAAAGWCSDECSGNCAPDDLAAAEVEIAAALRLLEPRSGE